MTEKPLIMASLNVRGLRGNVHKPKKIKAWMVSLSPSPPKFSSYRNTIWERKELKTLPKESNFGKGPPSGTKESQWVSCKE
jgi:hypothetical protein